MKSTNTEKKTYSLIAVVIFFIGLISSAQAAVYTAGHADLGLVEGESLGLHIHAGHAIVDGILVEDQEYEPDEIIIVVPQFTLTARPSGSQYDMIGNNAGDDTWILSQSPQVGAPFLGISAHLHEHGDDHGHGHGDGHHEEIFVDDQINLTLLSMSGPGEFSMWQTDVFGTPGFFMSTSDSGDDTITLDLELADHIHVNYGFTKPGVYELTFEASADLVAGGSDSSIATFTFNVVPEPASLCLLGLGAVLLRRKKL